MDNNKNILTTFTSDYLNETYNVIPSINFFQYLNFTYREIINELKFIENELKSLIDEYSIFSIDKKRHLYNYYENEFCNLKTRFNLLKDVLYYKEKMTNLEQVKLKLF